MGAPSAQVAPVILGFPPDSDVLSTTSALFAPFQLKFGLLSRWAVGKKHHAPSSPFFIMNSIYFLAFMDISHRSQAF